MAETTCALCKNVVDDAETCADLACRTCHVTIPFEVCVDIARRANAAIKAGDADGARAIAREVLGY